MDFGKLVEPDNGGAHRRRSLSRVVSHLHWLLRQRLSALKSGLFWRTFFLIAFIITVSMAAWIASVRFFDRAPQTEELAARITSIVEITRAALMHSAPAMRTELLFDLSSKEGIRIYPLEKNDKAEPLLDGAGLAETLLLVQTQLGPETRFAGKVNGVGGFWVSFKIEDDDEYWLMLERTRLVRGVGWQWLGWAGIVMLLSLLGGVIITRRINLPLARLTNSIRAMARGEAPDPLPENGAREIATANRAFNQMVTDLKRIETDRALILAGISHDLRTPLTRMQLEVEMADLSQEAREGMQSDISQMDAIISQFLDFAKPAEATNFTMLNLSELMQDLTARASRLPDMKINAQIDPNIHVVGNPVDLKRVLNNLVENGRRYGRTPDSDLLELDIKCKIESGEGGKRAVLEVADHGVGVPESEIQQLKKPFTRLDAARSQANGAGLGLAIVDRVVARHGGEFILTNRAGGGFLVRIILPGAKVKKADK
ncbi:ATP-binding protein [Massilia sp. W12]|uniref:ATP-binding protein n=1 Tax=Massilia sp. W12 TaxID=3126507 RepID=UPI0030CF0F68